MPAIVDRYRSGVRCVAFTLRVAVAAHAYARLPRTTLPVGIVASVACVSPLPFAVYLVGRCRFSAHRCGLCLPLRAMYAPLPRDHRFTAHARCRALPPVCRTPFCAISLLHRAAAYTVPPFVRCARRAIWILHACTDRLDTRCRAFRIPHAQDRCTFTRIVGSDLDRSWFTHHQFAATTPRCVAARAHTRILVCAPAPAADRYVATHVPRDRIGWIGSPFITATRWVAGSHVCLRIWVRFRRIGSFWLRTVTHFHLPRVLPLPLPPVLLSFTHLIALYCAFIIYARWFLYIARIGLPRFTATRRALPHTTRGVLPLPRSLLPDTRIHARIWI